MRREDSNSKAINALTRWITSHRTRLSLSLSFSLILILLFCLSRQVSDELLIQSRHRTEQKSIEEEWRGERKARMDRWMAVEIMLNLRVTDPLIGLVLPPQIHLFPIRPRSETGRGRRQENPQPQLRFECAPAVAVALLDEERESV